MLLQWRHTSLSTGKLTAARSPASSDERNSLTATTIGCAEMPVARSGNKSGVTAPVAVRPVKSSRKAWRHVANKSRSACDNVFSSIRAGARRWRTVVSVIALFLSRRNHGLKLNSLRGNRPSALRQPHRAGPAHVGDAMDKVGSAGHNLREKRAA